MALDTLLLEDGSRLLAEDGGWLLLEGATDGPPPTLRAVRLAAADRTRVSLPAADRSRVSLPARAEDP